MQYHLVANPRPRIRPTSWKIRANGKLGSMTQLTIQIGKSVTHNNANARIPIKLQSHITIKVIITIVTSFNIFLF
jgi:hypothetical protein